jgi:hypothetical protein
MRLVISLAVLAVACGSTPENDNRADALAILKRAVDFRDASFNDWQDACIVLTLRPSEDRDQAGTPLHRIPAEWVSGRRTTDDRFGCEKTLAYSEASFARSPRDNGVFAFVEVDRLCGPLCGDTGSVAFFRPDGSSDWQSQGFDSIAQY